MLRADENSSLLAANSAGNYGDYDDGRIDKSREMRQMVYSAALTLIFFFVELIGGYIAGSLAIMSDAAHMLSDLAGMTISLTAIWLSQYPPTNKMSFGYGRAEVIGVLFSLILIWVITGFLVVSAVLRLLYPREVNGPLMMLLGTIGLGINLLIGLVLGHGHFCLHDHGEDDHCHDHGHNCGDEKEEKKNSWISWDQLTGSFIKDPNIRAAFIHVLGDALQNIGVVIAGAIIAVRPQWTFIDPVVTLLFAVIVFMTTKNLAAKSLTILMEGVPDKIDLGQVRNRLESLEGVRKVQKVQAWSIGMDNHQIAVQLVKESSKNDQQVLSSTKYVLENEFKISNSTVQVSN